MKLLLITSNDENEVDEFDLSKDGSYDLNKKKDTAKLLADIIYSVEAYGDDEEEEKPKRKPSKKKAAKKEEPEEAPVIH